jgi:CDP-diacylglycerol--serine O-phosphatidyltransferase
MMVSTVKYPSFKSLGLRSKSTFWKMIGSAVRRLLLILRGKSFITCCPRFSRLYLVYGFVRPSLSRAWRREIEEDDDEPEAES